MSLADARSPALNGTAPTNGNGETGAEPPSSPNRVKRLPVPLPAGFASFWAAYACQRRVNKFTAWTQWQSLACEPMAESVLGALERFKRTPKWTDGYMPEPARWLKGRPWDDDALPEIPRHAAEAW